MMEKMHFRIGALRYAQRHLLQITMVFIMLLLSIPVWAQSSIHIIGHLSEKTKPTDQTLLENIFKRKIRVNKQGVALVPVNLPVDHPLRTLFSEILFGQEPEEMERYWNEQYFKGIAPPYVLSSMEAVKRFVVSTPGAMGYVLDCQDDEGSDLLLEIPLSQEQSGKVVALCNVLVD